MKGSDRIYISVSLVGFIAGLLLPRVADARLVACIGASITAGYGLSDPQNDSYPAQLERELRQYDSLWETRNFGVPGTVVLRNTPMTAYIETGACKLAQASEPDMVVIQLGGNDSLPGVWAQKANFIIDFIALIDAFEVLPSQPRIYIWIPTPIFSSPYGHNINVIRDEIIPLIKQLPTHRDVHLIDLYTPFEDKAYLFPDGIHPNIEGSKLIAQIVAEAIVGICAPPDFNGDGVVDIKDLLRLIHSWGGDDPSCDIAPPPFGDGIVDVLDLELLMSYWGQQVDDPTLVAHWALDETEGAVAYDSAGENDASVHGESVWQPEGGKVGGALAFDGVDDYAFAPHGLNPADGPFSVFAWIQGGAPGQVVISQLNGADWLSADPASGVLMTALCEPGRGGSSLKSESVITDGDWHRIGFVWGVIKRALYVDDILAVESTQKGLGSATGGLNIGCGMNSATGTFWSGLIDEIRIYNRPLSP